MTDTKIKGKMKSQRFKSRELRYASAIYTDVEARNSWYFQRGI
jgi:hypothetical protein